MTAQPLVGVFDPNETHKLVVDEKNNVKIQKKKRLNARQKNKIK